MKFNWLHWKFLELRCWILRGHSWNGCDILSHPSKTCYWCAKEWKR